MGSTTTHGLPYPVGTDRVMDGDNAMQALAEAVDAQLYAGTQAPAAPGIWVAATGVVVCTSASLAAAPGSTITARVMKIGKTVWYQGNATSGTGIVAGACVSLPNAQVGAPFYRMINIGGLYVMGSNAPAQSGVAYMHANLDRIQVVTAGNSFVDAPASSSIRWTCVYETA